MRALLLVIGITYSLYISSQTCQWATAIGGNSTDYLNGIDTDPWGNVYTIVDVTSNVTINSQTFPALGIRDIMLIKYRPNGVFCWAVRFGGADVDSPSDLACDVFGDIYISGTYKGTAIFGSDTLVSSGDRDIFLIKIDSSGNPLWTRSMGSPAMGNEGGSGLYYRATDNTVLMVGSFLGTATFVDTTLISAGGADIFISQWSATGNRLMCVRYGFNADDGASDVYMDGGGNIYTCGSVQLEMVLLKVTLAGSIVWTRSSSGSGSCFGNGITIDSYNNITVSGTYSQGASVTFSTLTLPMNAQWSSFLVQYDVNGNIRWARESSCTNGDIWGNRIVLDPADNIIAVNYFFYDFYTDTTIFLTNNPIRDGVIYKYSRNGELLWRIFLTEAADEAMGQVHYNNGFIYAGGMFSGAGTYGPSSLNTTTYDASLFKFSDCTPLNSTHVTGLPQVNNFACLGDQITLTSSFQAAGYSYQWTSMGVPLSGQTNPTFSPIADGVFAVNLTDPNGCTYPSAYVGLTFYPDPDTSLSWTNFGGPCNIDSIRLETANQPSCTYQWLHNGNAIPGATGMNYVATMTGTFCAIITNSFGCTDTSEQRIITYLGAIPNLVTSGDTSICAGESVQLFSSGATIYGWTPGASLSSSTSSSPVATPSVTTTYVVTGAIGNCWQSDTVIVSVNPAPVPALSCTFPSWILAANYWPVQWYYNNNVIVGQTGVYYTPPFNGTYFFTYTDSMGCTWQSNSYSILDAGTGEYSSNGEISVYPNPANQLLNVEFNSGRSIEEISVCTMPGQVLLTQAYNDSGGKEVINICSLDVGTYLLVIRTGDGYWIERFTKVD